VADLGKFCPGSDNQPTADGLTTDGVWTVTCRKGQAIALLQGDQLATLASRAVPGSDWAKVVAFLGLKTRGDS
jgi:hypothetical protein